MKMLRHFTIQGNRIIRRSATFQEYFIIRRSRPRNIELFVGRDLGVLNYSQVARPWDIELFVGRDLGIFDNSYIEILQFSYTNNAFFLYQILKQEKSHIVGSVEVGNHNDILKEKNHIHLLNGNLQLYLKCTNVTNTR